MNYIFQTSVLIMECMELNWLCKHIKKIRSSQPAIPVLNWVKHEPFPVSIVKIEQISGTLYPAGIYLLKINNRNTKKGVKYVKLWTCYCRLGNKKSFEKIKHLKSLQKAEVYSEPMWASTMELFVNIFIGFIFS